MWSPDGKRIIFTSERRGHRDIYQKLVAAGIGEDTLLLDVVTADGERFLINGPADEAIVSPITVVLNWTAELKR